MRLAHPFTRLALHVDADRLAAEVAALPEAVWQEHPERAPGNTAVPLVALGGDPDDPGTEGPMAPTPALGRLPYARSVLAALGAPIGRSRLMRIAGEGQLAGHVDTNRYWQDHLRVHVPVVSDPTVRFQCDDVGVHMAPGEAWVFDTWRRHGVDNPAGHARTHLVVDTVGSAGLWDLVARGVDHGLVGDATGARVEPGDALPAYEAAAPALASPWRQAALAAGILADLGTAAPPGLDRALEGLVADWHALWAVHGTSPDGHAAFRTRARAADEAVAALPATVLPNGTPVLEAVRQHLVRPALAVTGSASPAAPRRRAPRRIVRPVFVVSAPRSGSSLLFETLARAAHVHTIGGESHRVIEEIPGLHPGARGWDSNALGPEDATADAVRLLEEGFVARARDRDGRPPIGVVPLRLVEKTPKNALRVPFLAAAFPDATFVYLHRDPRPTISSMLAAWESGRFATYPQLPGWAGPPWSLLLVPGWRDLAGEDLPTVVAEQWARTTSTLLDDLEALGPGRWVVARHEALVADPEAEARRLCGLLGLTWDRPVLDPLPPSRTTLDPPAEGKWRRHETEIDGVWPGVAPVAERAGAVAAARGTETAPTPAPAPSRAVARRSPSAGEAVFASVHTASVPELLATAGCSVAVTTYQSGRVVILRADEEGRLGTHLRAFPRPMGLAVGPDRIALGTEQAVWELRDQPALAARLPGTARHDACFVPRRAHVTGDISVHDLAYAGDELWVVATRFSCLATLDAEHSFVPRWRPAFVTALAPEDRCHLNGVAVVDGRPRYVTALAMTDEPQGWRREKVGGGVVLDVDSGAVVAHGLSMPHSPRWHAGRLWVLDSGHGHLATVDLATGAAEPVVRLPGFPRGLAFVGPYALVGLSEVREHVFAGLPLAAHVRERRCGVWAVDTRSGEVAGFLRFEGDVTEVFDVQVIPGRRWPEVLEPGDPQAAGAFVLPDAALAEVPGG